MSDKTFDQFSLLHFASGIMAYFWGLPFWIWFILHVVFEILENTKTGMYFINRFIPVWPGGKQHPDSFMNSAIGDNISAVAGWIIASMLDKYVQKKPLLSLEHRSGKTKFKDLM